MFLIGFSFVSPTSEAVGPATPRADWKQVRGRAAPTFSGFLNKGRVLCNNLKVLIHVLSDQVNGGHNSLAFRGRRGIITLYLFTHVNRRTWGRVLGSSAPPLHRESLRLASIGPTWCFYEILPRMTCNIPVISPSSSLPPPHNTIIIRLSGQRSINHNEIGLSRCVCVCVCV